MDVDSRNKACLERMMTVLEEGSVGRIHAWKEGSSLNDEGDLDCSFEALIGLLGTIDEGWAENVRLIHFPGSNR